jgi:hypothetical protein
MQATAWCGVGRETHEVGVVANRQGRATKAVAVPRKHPRRGHGKGPRLRLRRHLNVRSPIDKHIRHRVVIYRAGLRAAALRAIRKTQDLRYRAAVDRAGLQEVALQAIGQPQVATGKNGSMRRPGLPARRGEPQHGHQEAAHGRSRRHGERPALRWRPALRHWLVLPQPPRLVRMYEPVCWRPA